MSALVTRMALLLVLSGWAPTLLAQDLELNRGSLGTYLRLKELQTTARVLHVVAHPDDEDGAMLAYCARGLGARTMLFSLTRGEGGANLISADFFDRLGALRTLEHWKAASYYGNELFYSRAADYGYSKTLPEAMKQWQNGIPLLADLVEVIRRERPHVILSRFRGDPRDGHGHHQMAGVLSRLAYSAAADPTQFSKQIESGLRPWQVTKLYVRAGSPWRKPDNGEWSIAIPTGTYDPVIGRTYAQIARFGLGFQRSQGMSGHDGDPGMQFSYYKLEAHAGVDPPEKRETSLLDGLAVSLCDALEVESLGTVDRDRAVEIQNLLGRAYQDWNPRRPDETVARLADVLKQVRELSTSSDASTVPLLAGLDRKLQDAIVVASGVELDAWVTDLAGNPKNHATSFAPLRGHVRLANANIVESLDLVKLQIATPHQVIDVVSDARRVAEGDVLEMETTLDTAGLPPTKPYWRRASIAEPIYQIAGGHGQRPLPKSPFVAQAEARIHDVAVNFEAVLQVRQRHPDYGRVTYPLSLVPPVQVRFPLRSGLLMEDRTTYDVSVIVQSSVGGTLNAVAKLELPAGWQATPPHHALTFQREDEVATVDFAIKIPPSAAREAHQIRAVVAVDGTNYDEGFDTVTARQVGRMNVYRKALHRVHVADVRLAGDPSIGYLAGSGDQVAESLGTLGVTPTMLTETDLASGDLARFDVILVGVRAYAVREDVREHNARLLDFVKRGGVLIVQYQTPEFDQNFGPYPYVMGNRPEEVSEEDAAVEILEPQHPLFQWPNAIVAADFDGWYEQRGSKFWKSWDDKYLPLLACHDTGQPEQRGGMLIAKYGKGLYIYSAYAWYRQLPNGVPGAYRLFANMLSLPMSELVR